MIVLMMKLKEEEDMIVETGKQDGFKCLVNDMIHTRVKVLLTREYHFEQRPLLLLCSLTQPRNYSIKCYDRKRDEIVIQP